MSSPAAAGPLVFVINPGSTSTKLAIFEGSRLRHERTVAHPASRLARFKRVADQIGFRCAEVESCLAACRVRPVDLRAVVGRGGLLRPLAGGTYLVGARMLRDLAVARFGQHASNLGAPLAHHVARLAGCPAFVVDPVVVDELAPEARLTGLPELPRRSVFHALSQRAAARRACSELGVDYGSAVLTVAHMGGGISVGAHLRGRVVDVNNALDGEGPMAAERSGALPAGDLVRLAMRGGRRSAAGLLRRITGCGGLVAHLGTNSLQEACCRAARGDRRARLVLDAMAAGVAKAITGSFAWLSGRPQAVVLTGGMCRSRRLVGAIRRRVDWAAPVLVYPENLEMFALAEGALRVLRGAERARRY